MLRIWLQNLASVKLQLGAAQDTAYIYPLLFLLWTLQGLTLVKPLCSLGPCPRVAENLPEKVLLAGWNSAIPAFLVSPLSCHVPPSLRAQEKSISTQKNPALRKQI